MAKWPTNRRNPRPVVRVVRPRDGARQTFYGFEVQVTNAASYLRTQLDDWWGVPAVAAGAPEGDGLLMISNVKP